jgi:hypothetical protein
MLAPPERSVSFAGGLSEPPTRHQRPRAPRVFHDTALFTEIARLLARSLTFRQNWIIDSAVNVTNGRNDVASGALNPYMKKLQLNDKRLTRPKGQRSSVNSKPVGLFSI